MSDEQAGSPDRNDSRFDAKGDGPVDFVLPDGPVCVQSDPEISKRAEASPGMTGTKTKKEIRGRGGLEPTRYGDWEIKGRCIDF